jgi:hypothetical protein
MQCYAVLRTGQFADAETQTSFHNLLIKVHQVSHSDLRKSRKAWARENCHKLAQAGVVIDLAASVQSKEQAFTEMGADVMERIGTSQR